MADPQRFLPLAADGLQIAPTLAAGELRIVMSGAVEARDPGAILNPYWSQVDEELVKGGIRRVELDLRVLAFMNSSGILTLVKWISQARAHPPAAAYSVAVRYDREITWQRTNVPILAKLAPGVVRLIEAG